MAGNAAPRYDSLTAVEYSTLRVPYETLNRLVFVLFLLTMSIH